MRAFVIKSSDIERCPIHSFAPSHYRDDGTCLCEPDTEPTEPGFEITDARYAKGQKAVRCASDGSGNKTRAMRLCAALNARYSNREHAYIMSAAKASKLRRLFDAGKDARLGDKNGRLGWVLS